MRPKIPFTRLFIGICAIMLCSFASCSSKRKAAQRGQHKNATGSEMREKYASQVGVSAEALKNEKLYRFIDANLGVPYRYGGTDNRGYDCSGFCCKLYAEVYNKALPRTTSELDKATSTVTKSKLEEGDLVFFDIKGKRKSHVGVYLINDYFVHASTSKGVVISNLSNSYYQKAFSKGGRIGR